MGNRQLQNIGNAMESVKVGENTWQITVIHQIRQSFLATTEDFLLKGHI